MGAPILRVGSIPFFCQIQKAAPSCQKSALCSCPVSPAFCRTSGSLSYLPRRTKIDPDRAHLGSIWARSGVQGPRLITKSIPIGRRSGSIWARPWSAGSISGRFGLDLRSAGFWVRSVFLASIWGPGFDLGSRVRSVVQGSIRGHGFDLGSCCFF